MAEAREVGARIILVVDDDPHIRRLLERVLARSGFAVLAAECLDSARAATAQVTPEWAIVDYHLSGCSGAHVIRWLNDATPGVTIIATSAGFTEASIEDVLAAGASARLCKPFSLKALRALLHVSDS